MRTTFVLTDNKGLQSAVRPRAEPHAIRAGDKVALTAPYDTEFGIVPAGSKGHVEQVDDDGTLWVFMEGIQPALVHWNNTLVLSPFTCEELAICTRLSVDKMPSRAAVMRACHSTGRLVAASLIAFVVGWMLEPPVSAQAANSVLRAIALAFEGHY